MRKDKSKIPVSGIRTVADVERIASAWEEKFFDPGLGFPTIWYRGQGKVLEPQPGILRPPFSSSCDHDESQISPKLHRLWKKERTLNRQFRRMSASLVPAGEDRVFRYFLAQHHGLPTRLLDWTPNPLAALYIAVSADPGEDGVIFVLNAKKLGDLLDTRDGRVAQTVAAVFEDDNIKFDAKIFAVMPDLFAGRMLQQGSCFTLHTPPLGLNSQEEFEFTAQKLLCLEKHVIPSGRKSDLLVSLRRLGVSQATLFPDLDHVAKEIRLAWRL
ncbi:MAG: FRG domain-containing protein [Verrucomicrobia bacterium]|nr:FRG domain-containing protein [Verrucomicrobiota bacterium]